MLNEDLRPLDLQDLIEDLIEIDSFASKMGEDKDICVLSFSTPQIESGRDLEKFLETGYEYVLDADVSPGEVEKGKYKVFAEIRRSPKLAEQILEVLDGVSKLTGVKDYKFRYYRSFMPIELTIENIKKHVPLDSNSYVNSIQENKMNNFTNFFNRSYLENVNLDSDNVVKFQRAYSDPLYLAIKDFGTKEEIYERTHGPLCTESKDIAEIMFLTKYIGNYNINKIGPDIILENQGWAIKLRRI